MSGLKVERLLLGQLSTNCYLVMNEETKELLIVDPAAQPQQLIRKIADMGGVPCAVLLTHGHFDHIGAADALRAEYDIPIYALEEERRLLASREENLSSVFGMPMTLQADRWLKDGQTITLVGQEITVLHTPGHTEGGACYYFPEEELLFSGDTLFCESVGRTDFPTGSMGTLVRSIREKLMTLPGQTKVFPGHDGATTIENEKRYNPFL